MIADLSESAARITLLCVHRGLGGRTTNKHASRLMPSRGIACEVLYRAKPGRVERNAQVLYNKAIPRENGVCAIWVFWRN